MSLEAAADYPPSWESTLFGLPLVGAHLNVVAQVQRYFSPLEDCVDFIAGDLNEGLDSKWVGRRVGVRTVMSKSHSRVGHPLTCFSLGV